jgi:Cellulase (glycosyl hydrolase family 5)
LKKSSVLVPSLIITLIFMVINAATTNNANNPFFIDSAYSQRTAPTTAEATTSSGGGPYIGVNVNGLATSRSEAKTSSPSIPLNYYDDSFRIISQGGMNHVRLVFYWEAYEKDPAAFVKELTTVAQTADKYGLKVMYDNHNFHTSSWLDPTRGNGFPSSFFSSDPDLYPNGGGGQTVHPTAKLWWTNWWNRSVKDASGVDGWTLQANFLKKIVSTVDSHPSTLGYEILSEPQVHSIDQWTKIGTYNTFMVNQLRTLTQKTIAYSMNIPIDLKSFKSIGVTGPNLAKMAPANKANVVFKISMYGSPSISSFQADKLRALVQAYKITGTPLYVGEWNNVKREKTIDEEGQIVSKINPELSDINQTEAIQMVQTFKRIGAWGAAYWIWNFQPHAVSNYNLVDVVSPDAPIQTTQYFDILRTAYSTVYGDIIMPTGSSSTTIQTCPDGSAPDANDNCLSSTTTVTTDQNAQQLQSDNDVPQPDH